MRPALLLPGLFGLFCLTCPAIAEDVKGPATGMKIAVVSLEAIFNNYKPFMLGEEGLHKESQQFGDKMGEFDEQLKQLDNSLHAVKENDPRHPKLEEDFETLKVKQKLFSEHFRTIYSAHAIELADKTFQKLGKLLEEYAHENGIMVVEQALKPSAHGRTIDDVLNQIEQHAVLYADPSLDITKPFLAYVNDRYAAEAAQSPTPPPVTDPGTTATPTPAPNSAPSGKQGQPTGKP
jgi:Skp family chaperone for outer membrane proteins